MARKPSIEVDLDLPVSGIVLIKAKYKQFVRSIIQRWQDRFDTENQRRFTVKKVLQGYVVIRLPDRLQENTDFL